MKANMTHPPQEVLIKVMCSERLPIQAARYLAQSEFSLRTRIFNGESFLNSQSVPVIAWYEPATRIVLTEEEYKELESERLAYKDFIEWWFKNKYDATENVGNFIETIRFIQDRLGY